MTKTFKNSGRRSREKPLKIHGVGKVGEIQTKSTENPFNEVIAENSTKLWKDTDTQV
jgi:hypothetical protein